MSEQMLLATLGAAAVGAIGGRFGGAIWDRMFGRQKAASGGNGSSSPGATSYSHALCKEKHAQIERRLDEHERALEKGDDQFDEIQRQITDGFAEIRAFIAVIKDRDRRGRPRSGTDGGGT